MLQVWKTRQLASCLGNVKLPERRVILQNALAFGKLPESSCQIFMRADWVEVHVKSHQITETRPGSPLARNTRAKKASGHLHTAFVKQGKYIDDATLCLPSQHTDEEGLNSHELCKLPTWIANCLKSDSICKMHEPKQTVCKLQAPELPHCLQHIDLCLSDLVTHWRHKVAATSSRRKKRQLTLGTRKHQTGSYFFSNF